RNAKDRDAGADYEDDNPSSAQLLLRKELRRATIWAGDQRPAPVWEHGWRRGYSRRLFVHQTSTGHATRRPRYSLARLASKVRDVNDQRRGDDRREREGAPTDVMKMPHGSARV